MLGTILNAVVCALIKFVNFLTEYILDTIAFIIGWVISLLPSIPWGVEPLQWGAFGNAVGYFIPISAMSTHFSLMLLIVATWYGVQHFLRLAKAIK